MFSSYWRWFSCSKEKHICSFQHCISSKIWWCQNSKTCILQHFPTHQTAASGSEPWRELEVQTSPGGWRRTTGPRPCWTPRRSSRSHTWDCPCSDSWRGQWKTKKKLQHVYDFPLPSPTKHGFPTKIKNLLFQQTHPNKILIQHFETYDVCLRW